MKQFVKTLNKDSSSIDKTAHPLPRLTMEKPKAGMFYGPQIRQIITERHFIASTNEIASWDDSSFVRVVGNFYFLLKQGVRKLTQLEYYRIAYSFLFHVT